MRGGCTQKILIVDLNLRTIKKETLKADIYRNFIGGSGLGARILYEQMAPKTDPLGPDNILGFVAGLLTGTPTPMATRVMVVTKSPLTGTWADSNAGGRFGYELKAAGYDAVFFRGISPKPVYLLISTDKVELKDAANLWGKDTVETEGALRQEVGDQSLEVACIGPSGEAESLLASVMCGGRAAGRQGVGAVMGCKKVKAVAVRGSNKVQIANPERFDELRREWLKALAKLDSMPFLQRASTLGTHGGISNLITAGGTPIKNWSLMGAESFPEHGNLCGNNIIKYQTRKSGCYGCPVACSGFVTVPDGPYEAIVVRKPEYETVAAFGPMCLNTNVESIIKANEICDRYGIDTISAGAVIAFAMECYEHALISSQDTGGIDLTWGSTLAIITMLKKVAKREGFGAVLADGVKKASERIGKGSAMYAMHVHGQEPGYHDPRLNSLRGLGYIASPRPGRHGEGFASVRLETEKNLGPNAELNIPEGAVGNELKGKIHAVASSYSQALCDSGMCQFAVSSRSTFPLVEFISAVTGWDFTVSEAITVGQRIQTLRQAFNIREGLTGKEFRLPLRLAESPKTGPYIGRSIDFDGLRNSYYAEMGWENDTGRPSRACLKVLGLEDLVGAI